MDYYYYQRLNALSDDTQNKLMVGNFDSTVL